LRAAANQDPAIAVPAAWALVTGSKETQAYVAEQLPRRGLKREDVTKYLAALDAPVFAERETASNALAGRGRSILPDLRRALESTKSPEVRRRVEDLMARVEDSYPPSELQAMRIVLACEFARTKAARALLERWARQEPETMLSEQARAALGRLDRRVD
jgi:hypothetical protein